MPVPRRKGIPSEAPNTLPCWPGLTSNRLGSGALNPGGGANSASSEAEVVSGWAALTRVVLARALERTGAALRGTGNAGRGSAAAGAAAGDMDSVRCGDVTRASLRAKTSKKRLVGLRSGVGGGRSGHSI
uniref:Uncharacterized protein n=1 Tax=Arundo donax TaxID=35708 RepID=A0A0A9HJA7_ARUDO